MQVQDAASKKAVHYTSEQVQRMLEERFGKEKAAVITICRFCTPGLLERCQKCRHRSYAADTDNFTPKHPPGVMENYIAAAD